MVPQLERIANRYSIPVYSNGGFNSLTAVRQIVADVARSGPTTILHLGDADPSGHSIFQAMFEDAAAFLDEEGPGWLRAERVALTLDQMEALRAEGIEPDEIKTKDTRSEDWKDRGLAHKLELEALAPDEIAGQLTDAITAHLDDDALAAAIADRDDGRLRLMYAADAADRAFEHAA